MQIFVKPVYLKMPILLCILSLKLLILRLRFYRSVHTIYSRDTHFHAREKSPTAEPEGFIFVRDGHEVRSSLGRRLRDIHVDRNCHEAARRLA